MEDQVARLDICGIGANRQNFHCLLRRLDRSRQDRAVCGLSGPGGVEVVPSVGQEVRPKVTGLGFPEFCDDHRLSALSSHALEALRRSKDDGSVLVPGSTVETGDIADFLWRSPRCFDPLQLASGNKSDGVAI